MTGPNRHPSDPATDRPVMGDHPELETDETRRYVPRTRDRDGRSPLLVIGAIVLIIVVVLIALVLIV